MDELHFSDIQKEKLIKGLSDANSEKNGGFMKAKFNIKKISAAVAACCILVGGTAFAAGQVTTIIGGNRLFSETSDFNDLAKLEEKTNIDISTVENFSNGYSFDSMDIEDMSSLDENDNKLNEYSGIDLTYKKADMPDIWLHTHPEMNDHHIDEESFDVERAHETRNVEGIILCYNEDEYLFLPVDVEPTEDEINREETDDHFFISSGSDERQTTISKNIVFEMDGIIYDLHSFDNDMSAEEFLDMAEEIVRAK